MLPFVQPRRALSDRALEVTVRVEKSLLRDGRGRQAMPRRYYFLYTHRIKSAGDLQPSLLLKR
jgi:hypothetical protein